MESLNTSNNKPFIITRNHNRTLLPHDYLKYDERAESYARFLQGIHSFLFVLKALNLLRFTLYTNLQNAFTFISHTPPSVQTTHLCFCW